MVIAVLAAVAVEEWYLFNIALMHCMFVPQLIKNAIENHKNALKPTVYLSVGIGRLALVLYIFGCPENFLVWRPKYWFVCIVATLMVLQIAALAIQSYLGARFMLPKRYKPQTFSYFRPLTDEVEMKESLECSICISELDRTDSQVMTTPCSHRFHKACLTNWMSIKLQCPTCRSELPAIED